MAFPLKTLRLSDYGNRKAVLAAIAELANANKVEAIVMGLPLGLNGSESEMSRVVRNAAEKIKRRLPLPFYWMPEALSSEEAKMDLQVAGLRGRKLKAVLDQQAACRILTSFLALPEDQRRAA